jgi:hypothetical protein
MRSPLGVRTFWKQVAPLLPRLDAIPPVHDGRRGRPRKRPKKAHGDKGYAFKGIPRIALRRHRVERVAVDARGASR